MTAHILEPAAQEFADATSKPPFLYELGPDGARKVLDDVQAAPIEKLDVDEKWITVPPGSVTSGRASSSRSGRRRPADGSLRPRRRLDPRQRRHARPARPRAGRRGERRRRLRRVRPLARGAVPGRDRAGLRDGPVDRRDGAAEGLDASRLAVAGDSVGGNMAAALTILAKQRGDVTFVHQSLYYPVTDAAQDTDSYREFADGPFLTARAMAWFWDAYLPRPGEAIARSRRRRCGRASTSSPGCRRRS